MNSDDTPVGRLLSRSEVLALIGASGAALVTGAALPRRRVLPAGMPACVVRPAQTQGPYFVDEVLNRTDIRPDPGSGDVSPGTRLDLQFNVSQIKDGACGPLAGAQVDVWHCDATGLYSDVVDPSFNTKGKKFLRGYQVTDAAGKARFVTVYPGWYPGRAVHVHFMIRTGPAGGRRHEFVSQVYFDEAVTDRVHAVAPYAKPGSRTMNAADRIYRRGGADLMLPLVPNGGGYRGAFDIGLDLS